MRAQELNTAQALVHEWRTNTLQICLEVTEEGLRAFLINSTANRFGKARQATSRQRRKFCIFEQGATVPHV
jgi:hypothetical protein